MLGDVESGLSTDTKEIRDPRRRSRGRIVSILAMHKVFDIYFMFPLPGNDEGPRGRTPHAKISRRRHFGTITREINRKY